MTAQLRLPHHFVFHSSTKQKSDTTQQHPFLQKIPIISLSTPHHNNALHQNPHPQRPKLLYRPHTGLHILRSPIPASPSHTPRQQLHPRNRSRAPSTPNTASSSGRNPKNATPPVAPPIPPSTASSESVEKLALRARSVATGFRTYGRRRCGRVRMRRSCCAC